MSDIFISYSSKDRPWVERFAKVLESYGWSVWWDRNIPTGGSFNAVIQTGAVSSKVRDYRVVRTVRRFRVGPSGSR